MKLSRILCVLSLLLVAGSARADITLEARQVGQDVEVWWTSGGEGEAVAMLLDIVAGTYGILACEMSEAVLHVKREAQVRLHPFGARARMMIVSYTDTDPIALAPPVVLGRCRLTSAAPIGCERAEATTNRMPPCWECPTCPDGTFDCMLIPTTCAVVVYRDPPTPARLPCADDWWVEGGMACASPSPTPTPTATPWMPTRGADTPARQAEGGALALPVSERGTGCQVDPRAASIPWWVGAVFVLFVLAAGWWRMR